MNETNRFLNNIINDIFKLLPMKEDALEGIENQLDIYIQDVVTNMRGAAKEYPILSADKYYMYAINKLRCLNEDDIPFALYRKTILDTIATIKRLSKEYEVIQNDK